MMGVCNLERYKTASGARKAAAYLRKHGIRAVLDTRKLGKGAPQYFYDGKGKAFALWVMAKDSRKAGKILQDWSKKRKDLRSLTVYPEDGTLDLLDMLIHDCRQYLLIAEGKIKDISEEGELALDEPTDDILKIAIRLKRLKDQCIRMTGCRPLDWQHGGGLR